MRSRAYTLVTGAALVAELATIGVAASADGASREVRRQQDITRQQQRDIHRLQTREQPRYETSPSTGEPSDRR